MFIETPCLVKTTVMFKKDERMKLPILIALGFVVAIAGCANPVNQVTADNYQETCFVAERNGNLEVAEEACGRALANVKWGNLGALEESQKRYHLSKIKRALGKFAEAEVLLKQSLALEEGLDPKSELRIGRRSVELAVALAGQGKWAEGVEHLTRAYGARNEYSASEKSYTALVLRKYAEELRKSNEQRATEFSAMAAQLSE